MPHADAEPALPEPNDLPVSQRMADDDRVPPPKVGDEKETLVAFLDYYRRTVEQKCAGVDPSRLSERSSPPSTMSLHGLVRHLAGVERWWFRIQFAGEDVPMLYYTPEDPDQDFEDLSGDFQDALDSWHRECERSREIVAAASLDTTGRTIKGDEFSLRWLLSYLTAEYAQHAGHADFLREGLDGYTGH